MDGEVRARILTDFPARFAGLRTVYLGDEATPYRLERSRLLGDRNEVLLKLGGVDSPEAAAKLRFFMVQVPTEKAVPLPPDRYYHYQILGLAVVTTDGRALGQVAQILRTGSNDVYVVWGADGEILIPAIADVVRQVDLASGRLVVSLLEGMEAQPRKAPSPRRRSGGRSAPQSGDKPPSPSA